MSKLQVTAFSFGCSLEAGGATFLPGPYRLKYYSSNPEGTNEFVAFLLGGDGQSLLKEHGLTLQEMHIAGDASACRKT